METTPPYDSLVARTGSRVREAELAAREDERRALARDLHDVFGQSLVALRLSLIAARDGLATDDPAAAHIEQSLAMLGDVHRGIRERALTLHSSVLDDLGLAPALRSHVRRLARSGAPIEFVSTGESPARWPAKIETEAFRIAQEAITNAIKHAEASRIEVSLALDDRSLEVRVADDGWGFDCAAARSGSGRDGLGLTSMAERARAAGGHLTIASEAGRGTTVRVRFQRRRPALRVA